MGQSEHPNKIFHSVYVSLYEETLQ